LMHYALFFGKKKPQNMTLSGTAFKSIAMSLAVWFFQVQGDGSNGQHDPAVLGFDKIAKRSTRHQFTLIPFW
jgi:hypothetical protein